MTDDEKRLAERASAFKAAVWPVVVAAGVARDTAVAAAAEARKAWETVMEVWKAAAEK